jgi:hypothetical protein
VIAAEQVLPNGSAHRLTEGLVDVAGPKVPGGNGPIVFPISSLEYYGTRSSRELVRLCRVNSAVHSAWAQAKNNENNFKVVIS